MKERFDMIESKLDRIDLKLDSHMERLTRIEVETAHNRGHIKMIISVTGAVVMALITGAIKYLMNHK